MRLEAGQTFTNCSRCGSGLAVPVSHIPTQQQGPASANLMRLAHAALSGANPDEANAYFTRVLEVEPNNVEAWLGKAEAAGMASTLKSPRFDEALGAIDQAIASAPEGAQPQVRRAGAQIASRLATGYFESARDFYTEYAALDDSWPDLVGHAFESIDALKAAIRYGVPDREPSDRIIAICNELLAGKPYYAEYDEYPQMRMNYLAPSTVQTVRQIVAEQVARLRAIDPHYVAAPDPMVVAQRQANQKSVRTAI